MNAQMKDGGVVVDISGITKPAAAKTVVALARKYIVAMNLVGKTTRHVHLRRDQYATLMDAVLKNREKTDPVVVGLRIDEIPVECAK